MTQPKNNSEGAQGATEQKQPMLPVHIIAESKVDLTFEYGLEEIDLAFKCFESNKKKFAAHEKLIITIAGKEVFNSTKK